MCVPSPFRIKDYSILKRMEGLLQWCWGLQKWIPQPRISLGMIHEPYSMPEPSRAMGSDVPDVDYGSWVVSNSIRGWRIHFWSPQRHQSNPSIIFNMLYTLIRCGEGRHLLRVWWLVGKICVEFDPRRGRYSLSRGAEWVETAVDQKSKDSIINWSASVHQLDSCSNLASEWNKFGTKGTCWNIMYI